jgi:hypothetical protein
MPQKLKAPSLETRNARLKLPIIAKPRFVKVAPGASLGYRRNRAAGAWVLRQADGKRGNHLKNIGLADDFDSADGTTIMDFWQAQERARELARTELASVANPTSPPIELLVRRLTMPAALEIYEKDLVVRGGDLANASRLRGHLPPDLVDKAIGEITAGEFLLWRAALAGKLSPAGVNRLMTIAKAMLNHARAFDVTILSSRNWEIGLAALADAAVSRNVILSEEQVRAIVAAAYKQSLEFGLLTELLAVTGARISQVARARVVDLRGSDMPPRLMMPSSRKGKGKKKVTHQPVRLPTALAAKLAEFVGGRPANTPLLLKPVEYQRVSGGPQPVWTAARLERLAQLLTEKLSFDDIAAELDTSKSAVAGILHRLRAREVIEPAPEPPPTFRQTAGGGPWSKSDHSRLFARAVVEAIGEDYPERVTIYALRHTNIVRQILAGVPLRVVAVYHDTSVGMLERHYSHYIGRQDDAFARIDLLDLAVPPARDVISLAPRRRQVTL